VLSVFGQLEDEIKRAIKIQHIPHHIRNFELVIVYIR
jgi:hypothetical protein